MSSQPEFHFAAGLIGMMVDIDDVQPHPENPNIGDRVAIWESIQENGFNDPIGVDRKTRYIVEGNTRWNVLKAHGAEHIPVIWLDFPTEEAALRYLLGHNATNRLGDDDPRALARLLVQLDKTPQALRGTGSDDQRFDDLLARIAEEDKVPGEEQKFAKQRSSGFGGGLTSCPECGWSRS